MAEDKKFPTPSMVKAQERWERMTEAEREALLNDARAELKKYYENMRPPIDADEINPGEQKV